MANQLDSGVASDKDIAILGLACRFPGAMGPGQFWHNLKNGVESISFFSRKELQEAGEDPALIADKAYVRAHGALEDVDLFDASFFDFSPREAELMDPQQRIFLECAWQALEDAGYDPHSFPGLIGVYAGVGRNTYAWNNLHSRWDVLAEAGVLQAAIGNEKDFLATAASYKMGLRGPSLTVQTACSTSLVAVHLACLALENYDCDIALAGGVTVQVPGKRGYLYQEGSILSPDGHCRPFDSRARGTVPGSGGALVVLKRLSDAIADGDHIRARIIGSAINNDGTRKVGYTAPSITGQAEVIAAAQAVADVSPETITYIEAHGTGTALGDPVEIEALTEVYREATQKKGFCAVGSVKSNLGHLDTAAGAAGLIKTVLSLERGEIPPSLHFKQPNPQIDLENSPFFVNNSLISWPQENGCPRRAGVSSFGIGGTNSHLVLEEAPAAEPCAQSRDWLLLPLSARTPSALKAARANLAAYLDEHPEASLADVAHTLQVGRKAFEYRSAAVCRSRNDAAAALRQDFLPSFCQEAGNRDLVFLFPGQGAQYPNMGRGLYRSEASFRKSIDHCAKLLGKELGKDLRELLFPSGDAADAAGLLAETRFTQPALFAFEHSLARLWMEWGLEPAALAGHSIGEYTAACLAGVFSLEDGLKLVAARGRLLQDLPRGAMLSVPLAAQAVEPLLGPELSLAADNAPSLCVVSGHTEAVSALQKELAERGTEARLLRTSHAFHSAMLEPVMPLFAKCFEGIRLQPPRIRFISNLTGTWITAEQATDPDYWVKQLRSTVRFRQGAAQLQKHSGGIFLEVGPGRTLTALVRQCQQAGQAAAMVASVPQAGSQESSAARMLRALGELWQAGVQVSWQDFSRGEKRRRVPLPTYPFERQRYWVEAGKPDSSAAERAMAEKAGGWFYLPHWKQTAFPAQTCPDQESQAEGWCIFGDAGGLGDRLADRLGRLGQEALLVQPGESFAQPSRRSITIRPGHSEDLRKIFDSHAARPPGKVLFLWPLDCCRGQAHQGLDHIGALEALMQIDRCLGELPTEAAASVTVVASLSRDVIGTESVQPAMSGFSGLCRSLESARYLCVDVERPAPGSLQEEILIEGLLGECRRGEAPASVAYRGRRRWAEELVPLKLDAQQGCPGLPEEGTYLITSGFDSFTQGFAEHLLSELKARVVFLTSAGASQSNGRPGWLQNLLGSGARAEVIEAGGTEGFDLKAVLLKLRRGKDSISGVIHGMELGATQGARGGSLANLQERLNETASLLSDLDAAFEGADLALRLFVAPWAVEPGESATPLNACLAACLETLIHQASGHWQLVKLDGWKSSEDASAQGRAGGELALPVQRAGRILQRLLAAQWEPTVAVSLRPLSLRSAKTTARQGVQEDEPAAGAHVRPELQTPYKAPQGKTERRIAELWQSILGLDRIGASDDFFELGGHSLLAIRVLARMEEAFGVSLELADLLQSPSVAEAALLVRQRLVGQAEEKAVERLPRIVPDRAKLFEPFPLTDLQQAYWIGRSMDFGMGGVAHGYLEVDCPGLDLQRMQGALRSAIAGHDMLHAVVLPDGRQQILEQVPPYGIGTFDLSGGSGQAVKQALLQVREAMSHQQFAADRWPLFDIRASILPGDLTRLHLSFDGLMLDGWSFGLLAQDLMARYQDPQAELPRPIISFRDYVLAERNLHGSPRYRRSLEYWDKRLQELPPPPQLPLKANPSELSHTRFTRLEATLEPQVWQSLKQRAARAGLTPSGFMLACFSEVLATWSKSPRFTINVPRFNRLPLHPQVGLLLGEFASFTLLAVDCSSPEPFERRARRLQEQLWSDLDHALVSGVEVLRRLRSMRDHASEAVMPVVFTRAPQAETGGGSAEQPGLQQIGTVGYSISQTPQVWLDHQVAERGGALNFNWDVVADLFPDGLMQDMFDAFCHLIARLSDDESAWQAQFLDLRPPAQQALLAALNDTDAEVAPTMPHVLFAQWAEKQPDRPAVIGSNWAVTYGRLQQRAQQVAQWLQRGGSRPNSLVAVVMEKGWEQVAAVMGVWQSGAAYLPLDPALPPRRLAGLLDQGEVRLVLTQSRLLRSLEWPDGLLFLTVDDLEEGAAPASPPEAVQQPDDLAYVIFTSGSTGRPKGVMIAHKSLVNCLACTNQRFGVHPDDRALAVTSMHHDLSVYDLGGMLVAGAALVMPDPESRLDPSHWSQLMHEQGVTVWNSVPALMSLLVSEARLPQSLRLVILGGDWVPVDLPGRIQAQVPDVQVVTIGGPTETTIWNIWYPIQRVDPSWKSIPYGRPIANNRYYILDERLAPCPIWVPGEMYCAGVAVTLGYWRDEEKSKAAFAVHPFSGEKLYRTGDLGRHLPDGTIEFLGREDFQVKILGQRIELGEIEAVLNQQPAVRSSVVTVAKARSGKQSLLAYFVARKEAGDSEELEAQLRRGLEEELPKHMVPSAFVPLESLPLTRNGKVDRKALARLGLPSALRASDGPRRPPSPQERILCEIWCELLELPEVGIDDDFFALGGHSLLAMQALSRVREHFGVEVSLRSFFESPSVASLAEQISRAAPTDEAREQPIQPRPPGCEPLQLSFSQERMWFLEKMEAGTAIYNQPLAVRLEGRLDPAVLGSALNFMVERHESLRTSFPEVDGRPVQVIAAERRLPLPLLDLSALPPQRGTSLAHDLLLEQTYAVFDLASDPLLRVLLIRLADEEHVAALIMHHIISDAWARELLLRELMTAYEALKGGQAVQLPPLPIQYADFSRWQREYLQGERLQELADYWARTLGGELPTLDLPTDRPRPEEQNFRGSLATVDVPDELRKGIADLGQRSNCSLFMTLLAGFQALLYSHTGQQDVIVGCNVANRSRRETENVIGIFINQLVLRTDLNGNPTFEELLQRVRDVTLSAYAHQDLPFEKLVEILRPERSLSRQPLFQVKLDVQNVHDTESRQAGLTVSTFEIEQRTTHSEMTLHVLDGRHMRFVMEFSIDLFDHETIRQWLKDLVRLLADAVADPSIRLADLSKKTRERERERWLAQSAKVGQSRREKLKGLKRRRTPVEAAR